MNGGLNLSELDGWWAEAYSPEVGWAIGDGNEHGDDPAWDWAEAETLYEILEHQVVPEFYTRDPQGIPRAWVARMRESMARLAPYYSANRVVRQYTESHYVPAAAAYCERSKDGGRVGADLLRWQRELAAHWQDIRFGSVQIFTAEREHRFEVQVYLGRADPESVQVEIYADISGSKPLRQPMRRGNSLGDSAGGYLYSRRAAVSRRSPHVGDYTPRVIPAHRGLFLPLEASQILWQR